MPKKFSLNLKSMKSKLGKLGDSVLKKKHKSVETNLEQLGKVADEAVDELEKEGKTEEAKKLREEAAAVQKDPSKVGEFNKKVKSLKLSKEVKNKLMRLSVRIEVAFDGLKNGFLDLVDKMKKKRERK